MKKQITVPMGTQFTIKSVNTGYKLVGKGPRVEWQPINPTFSLKSMSKLPTQEEKTLTFQVTANRNSDYHNSTGYSGGFVLAKSIEDESKPPTLIRIASKYFDQITNIVSHSPSDSDNAPQNNKSTLQV